MAVLSEITEILRRWDVWKRIETTPDRLEELEARVAELERRLSRAPGEVCPSCGEADFRVVGSRPTTGAFRGIWAYSTELIAVAPARLRRLGSTLRSDQPQRHAAPRG